MDLKQRLLSNMFSRNVLTDLGLRSTISTPKNDKPFFQYRIGKYQQDYYLYFPKEPMEIQYKNEIFNKIRQYSGYEISRYLSFHFDAFEKKKEFLEFLKYEAEERPQINVSKKFKSRLHIIIQWIEEKEIEIEFSQKAENTDSQDSVSKGVQLSSFSGENSQILNHRFNSLLSEFEEKMEVLSKTYNPGSIQLINSANNTKLIQLLIVLRDLQTTHKKGTPPDQLFKSFSSSDIASLLQQHFCHFQNKKINTVQKEITAVNSAMDYNQEGIKKLNKALVEFFYEK